MSLRKRGKRWYYTIEIGTHNGKRKRIERLGGRTKAEAQKAFIATRARLDRTGMYRDDSDITVGVFMDHWLSQSVVVELKSNTFRRYQSVVEHHIKPVMGDMKIREITPLFLQNFLNEKKGGRSRATVASIYAVLKKSFAYAVDICQYIQSDPAVRIHVPKFDEKPHEISPFSSGEMQVILSKWEPGHQYYMAVRCSYYIGLREGECAALQWEDVDLDKNLVHIHATLLQDGTIQQMPKSLSSDRVISFGKQMHDIFQSEKIRQLTARMEYGKYYQGHGFICCRTDGSMLRLDDFRYFRKWCRSNLNHGNFHTLRHTHATMLLEDGMELELVSKRLGHASILVTSKTYSHILQKRAKKETFHLNAL